MSRNQKEQREAGKKGRKEEGGRNGGKARKRKNSHQVR